MWIRAEHAFYDGYCEGIDEDVWVDVFGLADGLLLDVARVAAEVAVRGCLCVEVFGFGDHARVESVEVGWVDGVFEREDPVPVEGFQGVLEIEGVDLVGLEFFWGELYEH